MAPLLKIFHMAVSSPLGGRYSPMEKKWACLKLPVVGEETATEQPDNFVPRVKTTAFSPHVLLWTDGVLSLLLRCPNAELSSVINSPHSCVCVCVWVCLQMCVLVHVNLPTPAQVTRSLVSFRTQPCVKEGHTQAASVKSFLCYQCHCGSLVTRPLRAKVMKRWRIVAIRMVSCGYG